MEDFLGTVFDVSVLQVELKKALFKVLGVGASEGTGWL